MMKRFQVDFLDYNNGATSPIDTVTAPDDYTAEQYVKDCEANAEPDWVEMLHNGQVTLTEITLEED